MKKIWLIIPALLLYSAVLAPASLVQAKTLTKEENVTEVIRNIDVDITVNKEGTIHIVEAIVYDFKYFEQNGIIREIPLTSVFGNFDQTAIQNVVVTDGSGELLPFTVLGADQNILTKIFDGLASDDKEVTVKVGSQGDYVTGLQTYLISYDVKNALGYFDDRTEIYWNAIGQNWLAPIEVARVRVSLPGNQTETLHLNSYCGERNATTTCLAPETNYKEKDDVTVVTFVAPDALKTGEGMTVAVGFTKDLVAGPTKVDLIIKLLLSWWGLLLLPAIVFWWFRKTLKAWQIRRHFYQNNPIVTEFTADEFDPLQVAGIVNGSIKQKDIGAQIIHLAINEYLALKKDEKGYSFLSTDKATAGLEPYNQTLYDAIKDENTTSLKASFFRYLSAITTGAMASLSKAGSITYKQSPNPTTVLFLGLFLAVNPGVFVWILLGVQAGLVFSGACLLIAILTFVFKPRQYALSASGLEIERKLLGLRRYIDVAEDERIKFHNAPEKSVELFERHLPYAMVFGLEMKWVEEFKNIYIEPPTWFRDDLQGSFSSSVLTETLTDLSEKIASTPFTNIFSRSGSSFGTIGSNSGSSSGFSGGGGGGGGGRSW